MPNTVDLDSERYALLKGTRINRSRQPAFSQVQRQKAQIAVEDFGLYQQILLTGPLGIGQRSGNRLDRCFDQKNVIAWWPGQITRGPQKQTSTWSSPPTTFLAQPGAGLLEIGER